jgi:hypothetical protein
MPYRVRRGLIPVMDPVSDSPSEAPSHDARPAGTLESTASQAVFRAPWGELERQLPYVVITTQAWPEEWWRPPGSRAPRRIDDADRSSTLVAAAVAEATPPIGHRMQDPIARATDAPSERLAASVIAVPVDPIRRIGITAIPKRSTTVGTPAPARGRRRAPRREPARRGSLARLVLVAVGLVLSLIAVESASRRRH